MKPLADQLRPQKLEDIVGQDHILGPGTFLSNSIEQQKPRSFILWGPPGCGKTTLARVYAKAFEAKFVDISAVFGSVADIKKVVTEAQSNPLFFRFIILFVDEIHRFNKAQQDAFLPYIENGLIVLIGATTENPSFALNNALLSRAQILPMHALNEDALEKIIVRYEEKNKSLSLIKELRDEVKKLSQGDGRYLLNLIETLSFSSNELNNSEDLYRILQKKSAIFDKNNDYHYNTISALHKSIRGSDPDAALYWLCRILNGGQDPLYIARRLIRMASEDIGLADPNALQIAIGAKQAFEQLGSPEGDLALAQAVVYLALAPKSNALYKAFNESKTIAAETSHLNPPLLSLNAPNPTMKKLGLGLDYKYDHDTPNAFSGQNYFPDSLTRQKFYRPVERGFEREMNKRIEYFETLRKNQ